MMSNPKKHHLWPPGTILWANSECHLWKKPTIGWASFCFIPNKTPIMYLDCRANMIQILYGEFVGWGYRDKFSSFPPKTEG